MAEIPPTVTPVARGAAVATPAAALCAKPVLTAGDEVETSVVELPLVKVIDVPLVLTTEPEVLTIDEPTLPTGLEDTVLTGDELALTKLDGLFDHSFILHASFLPHRLEFTFSNHSRVLRIH